MIKCWICFVKYRVVNNAVHGAMIKTKAKKLSEVYRIDTFEASNFLWCIFFSRLKRSRGMVAEDTRNIEGVPI